MGLIGWIVAGTLIGIVGRAVIPTAGRKAPPVLAVLAGLVGVALAALAYGFVAATVLDNDTPSSGLGWAFAVAGGVGAVLVVCRLAGRRPRVLPAGPAGSGGRSSVGTTRAHVFVSYRREDAQALAGRIADHLKLRFPGAVVFFDVDSISPGVNFRSTISRALEQSHVLLAVIDRDWSGTADGRHRLHEPGDFVAFELRTAAQLRIPVIPVIDPYASMPAAASLPADLAWFADQNALQLHHDIGFDHEMARLDEQLLTLLPAGTIRRPRSGRS